jgi:hypothetical protein
VEWSSEVGAADWILDRLHPFAQDVGSFVPEGFEAYARVLHPARPAGGGDGGKLRWVDLARESGAQLGAGTRFEDLAADAAIQEPLVGSLEGDELDALVELLGVATGTPESCWFGIWEGYGWMQGQAALGIPAPRPGPRVDVPERPLVLYRGSIAAAAAFSRVPPSQSPNLWWPQDRAWCVASEIDHHSSYVGGDRSVIDRVLGDPRLEALPVDPADPVTD